jgi:hypothetical protein
MQYDVLHSDEQFVPEPQGDFTKGADKRKFQLVRVLSISYVCNASEHLHTFVKV